MTDLAPLAARISAAAPAAPPDAPSAADPKAARRADLRRVATEFEAVFLAEMLTHAGVGRATPGFDGGAGEAAFASRLTAAQAQLIAERGGIGVGDALFAAMLERESLAPAGRADDAPGPAEGVPR